MSTTNELRTRFLEYFRQHGHEVVSSSSLVPGNDPTLLFTNAGMVPFKDVFLGREDRGYKRAASSQRCVRAGGKHNDLENVGYTARHHTFFEMLGNFSFGDYFKREAIQFAWGFLTEELGLPPERLWITVFDEDEEAADIWLKELGVDPERFSRIGAKDNFWQMGDTGPCGPCSEIFYDHGPEVAGGPPGTPDEDGDRYVEIWNLVFTQFDRTRDGHLNPLPHPSVDTGMGLERLAAVMQGVHSNYDIDLFQGLIQAAAKATGCQDLKSSSLKVIADHIRSAVFMIVDGVTPGNEGRGYVLRRIMRRAIRHGHKLGAEGAFFYQLVAALEQQMGEAYPELTAHRQRVEKVIRNEEARFSETLEQGMRILNQAVEALEGSELPGDVAFQLYDTYGFPVDLTADVLRERGLSLDEAGFEREMEAQRSRARAASSFSADYSQAANIDAKSEFTGYTRQQDSGTVVALLRDGEAVDVLEAGQEGAVVLDRTPFYAESGGQVGDRGQLASDGVVFVVNDTRPAPGGAPLHVGAVQSGEIRVGDQLNAEIDIAAREAIMRNHSATHLLHAALRKVLGDHVVQKGSLVDAARLRFDFSHPDPVTQDELDRIEDLVTAEILENVETETTVQSYDEAVAGGAMALFGEKYADQVRVLRFGDFSCELCGGTHVGRTGDIGIFKIVSESGIAGGIRRIEALTGRNALSWVRATEASLGQVARLLKTSRDDVPAKVEQLSDKVRSQDKELQALKGKLASSASGDLISGAVDVSGVRLLATRVEGVDGKGMRDLLDKLKDKMGSGVLLLGAANGSKVSLIAGVTKDLTDRVKAGELINHVAEQVGGKGGGRPDMAQAGGSQPENLDAAIASVSDWLAERLN